MTIYTANIVPDPNNPDELLLDLGVDLCEKLGWAVGDSVEWIDNKDGTWTLQKVNPSES